MPDTVFTHFDKYYEHYALKRQSDGEILATVSAPAYQAASPFGEARAYADDYEPDNGPVSVVRITEEEVLAIIQADAQCGECEHA